MEWWSSGRCLQGGRLQEGVCWEVVCLIGGLQVFSKVSAGRLSVKVVVFREVVCWSRCLQESCSVGVVVFRNVSAGRLSVGV